MNIVNIDFEWLADGFESIGDQAQQRYPQHS